MRDLNTLLRDIHARADSLAIFAQHAAALDSTVSTRKTEYAENALDNLAALQSLQNELLTYFLTLLKKEQAESYTIVMNPNAQKWLTRNWKAALKDDTEHQWDTLENALNILEVCAPTDEERREYAFLGHLALTHLLRVGRGKS